MPKTLPITKTRSASSASPGRSGTGAIALFAIAYIAVLGILFAPDGYFTPPPGPVTVDAID